MPTNPFKFAALASLGLLIALAAYVIPAEAQVRPPDATSHSSVTAYISPLPPFSRNLTIGSVGSEVRALQTWLMARGFGVPAGATGYFGSQTRAALARYQTVVGIRPAVGYFGSITRAKINNSLSVPTLEVAVSCFTDSASAKSSGVDGATLLKTYPGLKPADFIGVHGKEEGGNYSVQNGQLVFTGNAASDSADLTCLGMRTVFENAAKRLSVSAETKLDIEQLLLKLKSSA